MASLSDVGMGLVAARRRRGLTQSALASLVGVKRQQIQRWEATAYRGASLHNVTRVADALGWSPQPVPLASGAEFVAAESGAAYADSRVAAEPGPDTGPAAPVRDLGEIVARVRPRGPDLLKRFGVTRIAVFGSFARGEQSPSSDVDVIVEVDKPSTHNVFGVEEELSAVLGRKVDAGALRTLRPRVRPYVERELVDVWRA